MTDKLITLKNISKSFAGVQALKNVDLSIKAGEVRCLAGENGSGKSTLIKVIAGVYTRDNGDIEINGNSYQKLSPIDSIKEGIQIIYQDFSLFPNLTVAENIAMNYELAKEGKFVNWKEINDIAKKAINRINLDIDITEKVENLSVADKQLVAISRALLYDAKLIIMDEPTTALTRKEVNILFGIINDLKKEGISILFVSHKLNEVFQISDNITILRNGELIFDGSVAELDRKKLELYMTGRNIDNSYTYVCDISNKGSLLEVKNLSKRDKFKDISFDLCQGEILGITGLLGSGRTELALSLFGLNPADDGVIRIEGKDVKIKSVQDAVENRIAYVPEDRLSEGLLLEQSIANNINICTIDSLRTHYNLIDEDEKDRQIIKWIEDLKIKVSSVDLPVKSLSGGNQQRVVIAKWLATKPKILILNGPSVGVDIGSKEYIHKILRKLAQQGMGIILISDDIPEITNNCSRIILMRNGEIKEEYLSSDTSEEHLAQRLLG